MKIYDGNGNILMDFNCVYLDNQINLCLREMNQRRTNWPFDHDDVHDDDDGLWWW